MEQEEGGPDREPTAGDLAFAAGVLAGTISFVRSKTAKESLEVVSKWLMSPGALLEAQRRR
jgi:hypothetical protein